ncbi:hypothetical protein ACOSP7_024447 [Xanthoceras sorbifolium]|uniref:RING-type E3 ubiquitin transferase n=1 Tax=Xanthoceras sorbifolium TaxID=99658 RepID=A0ABQ8H8V4_9ROSI|nr:hypothetical protein JRO89_XS13G0168900 [Xanthoceras sorbifolium]
MASINSVHDYYRCEAFQPEDYLHGDGLVSSRKALLFIEFYVSVDGFVKYGDLTLPTDELTSWFVVISSKLSQLDVPYDFHSSLVTTITNCASSIISEDRNSNCDIIPMVVKITDEEEAISRAATLSIDGQPLDMVPANESSIQALKKTKVEGCSRQCVICLEEISVGSEATRMPCSHVYHQDCIVSWLEQSNLCPLCRFQIPVKSSLPRILD